MSEEQDNKTISPPPVPSDEAPVSQVDKPAESGPETQPAGQPEAPVGSELGKTSADQQGAPVVNEPTTPDTTTAESGATVAGEPEEPIFPIEEFVGDSPKKEEIKSDLPGSSSATSSAPAASTSPSVPGSPSSDVPVAAAPPPVPKNGDSPKSTTKKPSLLSFFARKPKSTPPPVQVGQRAVIKRSSNAGKIILWILGALVMLAAIFYLFFYKVTVNINTSPAPDLISIDGKSTTDRSHKLNPGLHEIKIEKSGYISYNKSREFRIGERLNLNFSLQKANVASPAVAGAKSLSLSASGRFINFLGSDSRLYSIALDEKDSQPVALSLEQFPPIRQIKFSTDNNFALVLDQEAFKIADFARLDPTAQEKSVALPPAASAISSFSWNNKASSYVNVANSKIIYDMKTSTGWDLLLMDRANNHSQIVMRIDPARFKNLSLDWSDNDKMILLVGNEAGLLDLGTREYTAIEENGGFTAGKWGPGGKSAVLIKNDSAAYQLKDGKAVDLKVSAKIFSFKNANEAYFIEGEKIVLVNFDSGSRINYAEISGLKNAVSFAVSQDSVYFLDSIGIQSAKLQEGAYEAEAKK